MTARANRLNSASHTFLTWTSKGKPLAIGLPFAVTLLLYLVFPNRNYSGDAVLYAHNIELGTNLFHPHHLVYQFLGWGLDRTLRFFSIRIEPLSLLAVVNSLFGSAGILFLFLTIHRLVRSPYPALLSSLGLAASFGYWNLSILLETYIIPSFLILVALFLLVRAKDQDKAHWSLPLVVGLLNGTATLFHEMFLLFFIPVLAMLYWWLRVRRPTPYVTYLLSSAVLVVGSYLIVGFLAENLHSMSDFYAWLTGYAGTPARGGLAARSILDAAIGFSRAFVDPVALRQWLVSKDLSPFRLLSLGLFALSLIALAVALVVLVLSFNKLTKEWQKLYAILALWFVAFGLFALWWEPHNYKFWLPAIIPFWIAAALLPKRRTIAFVSLMTIIFITNFFTSTWPNSDLNNNDLYQLTLKLRDSSSGNGDLVLHSNPGFPQYQQAYLSDRKVESDSLAIHHFDTEEDKERLFQTVRESIRQTLKLGGKVFISEREIRPSSTQIQASKFLKPDDYTRFYAQFQPSLVPAFTFQEEGAVYTMYVLTPS